MLPAVLHTLSIERITCSDCCIWRCDCEGSCFRNDQNLCPCRTIVWATAVTNVAQPSLSQTPQLSTLQPLLSWRQLTHMSSAVSEPATKTGRQQELGIAGPKEELNFFFSLLAKLFNIILLVLKLLFLLWRAIKLYFVLKSSTSRSCLWNSEAGGC